MGHIPGADDEWLHDQDGNHRSYPGPLNRLLGFAELDRAIAAHFAAHRSNMNQREVRKHDPDCTALDALDVGDVPNHAYCDCSASSRHPGCDVGCIALNDPQTVDELKAALEHWRFHSYLSGCSHAAS